MEIYDGAYIASSQKILLKSKGDLIHGYHLTFLAQFRLYYITSCRYITHIILQLYTTMALHSSHITNFHIIQTVYTFFILYNGLFLWVDIFTERLERSSKIFFIVLNFMLTVCGFNVSMGHRYQKRALVAIPCTCTSCVTVNYYPSGNTSHIHFMYVAAHYVS